MASNKTVEFRVTGSVLAKVARKMAPFYYKIAVNKTYAKAWSKAVREADLDKMEKLFQTAVTGKPNGLSANGIGYFVDFEFPKPILQYTNGTSIIPGTAQFTFATPVHRAIAKAILLFYIKLSTDRSYAASVASAVRSNNKRRLSHLVRMYVTSKALKSITIDFAGFSLGFKYRGVKHTYENTLFREFSG
ncbi:hypothetical protein ACFPYJ_04640 [Paenibacillus solisilvae]|uniref:Uncharacterized protein n=1 Tax=Paenibacillus solisilvae TaxID=2486751 RepID=A0ABW0VRC6_9BACL